LHGANKITFRYRLEFSIPISDCYNWTKLQSKLVKQNEINFWRIKHWQLINRWRRLQGFSSIDNYKSTGIGLLVPFTYKSLFSPVSHKQAAFNHQKSIVVLPFLSLPLSLFLSHFSCLICFYFPFPFRICFPFPFCICDCLCFPFSFFSSFSFSSSSSVSISLHS